VPPQLITPVNFPLLLLFTQGQICDNNLAVRVILDCHTLYTDAAFSASRARWDHQIVLETSTAWGSDAISVGLCSNQSFDRTQRLRSHWVHRTTANRHILDSHTLQQQVNYSFNIYKNIRVSQ